MFEKADDDFLETIRSGGQTLLETAQTSSVQQMDMFSCQAITSWKNLNWHLPAMTIRGRCVAPLSHSASPTSFTSPCCAIKLCCLERVMGNMRRTAYHTSCWAVGLVLTTTYISRTSTSAKSRVPLLVNVSGCAPLGHLPYFSSSGRWAKEA